MSRLTVGIMPKNKSLPWNLLMMLRIVIIVRRFGTPLVVEGVQLLRINRSHRVATVGPELSCRASQTVQLCFLLVSSANCGSKVPNTTDVAFKSPNRMSNDLRQLKQQVFNDKHALQLFRLFVETVDEESEAMPGKNHTYYHANDHRLERAFSAPTPSGESFSTMTTDTAIQMSNIINNRDHNGGSKALLLGHHTPRNDRKRGLGNDYESDATLLTTTSTVGIISETKKASKQPRKVEESRTHSAQKPRRKLHRPATPPPVNDPSACRLAFMVVGALVIVFAFIFGTIYLIIYRMKLLEEQS